MQRLNIKSISILIKFYMIMMEGITNSFGKTQIISKIHKEFFFQVNTKTQDITQILIDYNLKKLSYWCYKTFK